MAGISGESGRRFFMKRIAILGTGGMGTVLARLWSARGASVRLWGRDREKVEVLRGERRNPWHLPGVEIPREVEIGTDLAAAAGGADLIVAAVPSQHLRATLSANRHALGGGTPILSVIKGIEVGTFATGSRIIKETLGADRRVAILSGPSHAEELGRDLPASMVVAGEDEGLTGAVRDGLNKGMLRVYTNGDPTGVELAGALKNVMAIAAGVCEGLGLGDNAKAALLTRGLVEMTRFGERFGADRGTFMGLAGIGDLLTTCYSPHGRNRAVGMAIGMGSTAAEHLARTGSVAEGVPTCRSVHEAATRLGVDMPITREVFGVVHEGKSPREALRSLMERSPKEEMSL